MASGGRAIFDIDLRVNKSGLNEIIHSLQAIQAQGAQINKEQGISKEINSAIYAAKELERILKSSWNTKLDTLDLNKLNTGITKTYGNLDNLKTKLGAIDDGKRVFTSLTKEVLNTNIQLKKSKTLLDELAQTMTNTVKWGITSSIFNTMTDSIQNAWNYAKALDSSLNDIRIVTGKSADEMASFAVQANKVAKSLGAATKDYTNASLIYYQQGLNEEDVQARAQTTLKAANVTGQSGQEVSEQLTAVWNGYKVSAQEAELYVDKLAAVAAETAADLEELSTGMSKVASAANLMGVDIDQLNAQLATIVSVTRQAPESVGTALKTIYARMGDIKAGLDGEVTLDEYTSQMAEMGVNVLDANGQLRDMGTVIEEIGSRWKTMSREQQISLSQVMAGTRQYNNLLSLFDNWNMYTDALNTSSKAAGTLQQQQETYMESMSAHLQKLTTETEKTYDIIFDEKQINIFLDALTNVVSVFNNLLAVTSKGNLFGGVGSLSLMGANLFSSQIAQSINQNIQNRSRTKANTEKNIAQDDFYQTTLQGYQAEGINFDRAGLEAVKESYKQIRGYAQFLTDEQQQEFVNRQKNIGLIAEELERYKNINKELQKISSLTSKDDGTYGLINLELLEQKVADSTAYVSSIEKTIKDLKKTPVLSKSEKNDIFEKVSKENENIHFDKKSDAQAYTRAKIIEAENAKILEIQKQNNEKIQEQEKLLSSASQELEEQKNDLIKVKKYKGDLRDLDNDIVKNLKEQKSALMEQQKEAAILAKNTQQIQNGIQLITGGLNIVQTLIGTIKTLTDEDTSIEDKITQTSAGIINITLSLMQLAPVIQTIAKGGGLKVFFGKTLPAALGISAGGFKALTLSALPWIGIAAALILIVVKLAKAYTAEADAAKEAQQHVEDLTLAHNQCTESVKKLQEAMSHYDDAVDSLKELKKGTDEYKEALEKANEEAKTLIEQYKLYDKWNYDESGSGLIKIDPNALKDSLEEEKAQERQVAQNLKNATINANQRQTRLENTQFSRKVGALQIAEKDGLIIEGSTRRSEERKSESAQLDNKSVETIVNGLNLLREKDANKFDLLWSEGQEETLKNTILSFGDISDAIRLNIDQIIKQKDALEALTQSTYDANQQIEYYAKEALGLSIEGEYEAKFKAAATKNGEVDETLQENFINALTTLASDIDKKQGNGYQNTLKNIDVSNVTSTKDLQKYERYKDVKNDEELARQYAQDILGKTAAEVSQLIYKSGSGKGTLTTQDGTVVLDSVNDKTMRQSLARYAESEDAKENYQNNSKTQNDQLANQLEQLANKGKEFGQKYGTDFTNGLIASIASGSENFNFSSIFSRLDPNEITSLMEMSNEQLASNLGLNEEKITQLGYDSLEHFATAFKNGFAGYEWNIDDAFSAAMETRDADIDALGLTKQKTEAYREELQEYGTYIMRIAEDSAILADSLETDADAAVVVGQSVLEMNKGIDELADGIEDWTKILKNSTKESEEYSEAINGIAGALSRIYGVEEKYISNDFITKHMEEIQQAAKGSETAIESLRKELTKDIILNIVEFKGLGESDQNQLLSDIEKLQAQIPNIEVGASFEIGDSLSQAEQDFIDTMNNIITNAGLTAEQANALFSTMGFETTFATEEVDMPQRVPEYVTETIPEGISFTEDGKPMVKTRTRTYQDGVYEATGKMTVMAMETAADGKTKVPKIQSITKKGTGVMNNYSSVNKGGGAPGTKKSGGSDKDPDKKDPIENEKDVYHDIDIILKQISTDLERLETQEKKLVGQDLIDNLNKQWGKLQDTIDATNEKIKIARGEMARLQGELGAKGVTFNPDGTIANYAAAYDQQLATVNAVIAHYNSLSAEAQEGYKDTVEQAEKNWEEFLDNLEKYDETVSELIPELEDEIQAAIDEQIEIQIEKFNMEIELRLDMAEAEREWNEFKKRIIDDIEDDDILGNASAKLLDYSSYYKEDGTGVIQKNTQHVNEIIEQLKSIEATGTSSIYGDNEAQALEDLKTYYEQLMSDLTDVHDLVDEIRESYLDMMDEAQEKFDEQVETYEYIRDLLTHDMDLITMVYGDESYDKLVNFYQKQEENYNKQIDFQRQQKDFWKAQMDSLEEGSDEWQKAKENWMSAVEEWNSTVEAAIENLQDKYLNAINNIFANLNDKVTGGLGLDYVEQEWDLINKNADQYLDTINAVFETQQLENKYLDAIDNTDNISAQRKLNDLMKEEIAALEQKDKLTQYDIDRANLKYEIALKQIALEEAQQTKSSMRLRRDSQGNYRYEFVADNDAIAEAEDELSVLQNQLYNMDVEQYRGNLDQLYEIYVEWQEALAEAAQINDPEARAERELMINEQYGELINGIVEENEVIKTNLRESAFDELVNLHQMELEEVEALSQAEKDIMLEDMVPQWTSGVQTMADTFAGEGGFIPTCKDALIELDGATKDYEDSLLDLQYQGGFTFNDIVAGENEAIYTAMGLLQVNNELINSYKAEFDALNAVLGQLDGLIGKYGSAQNAANAAAEAAYKYADALLAQFAAANGQYTGRGNFYSSSGGSGGNVSSTGGKFGVSGTSGTGSSNSATSGAGASGRQKYHMDFVDQNQRTQYAEFWASSDEELRRKIKAMNPHEGTGILMYNMGTNKTAALSTYTIDKMKMFNTGGYTGEWNSSEGKLAMLHQKELVLNQRDTENILGAVEIMRHVTNSIDNSIFARVADFTSGIGVAAPNLANEALEQNVHIEANFPNVQNSNEVEEALNNLVNIAAQRANRNNRN